MNRHTLIFGMKQLFFFLLLSNIPFLAHADKYGIQEAISEGAPPGNGWLALLIPVVIWGLIWYSSRRNQSRSKKHRSKSGEVKEGPILADKINHSAAAETEIKESENSANSKTRKMRRSRQQYAIETLRAETKMAQNRPKNCNNRDLI